MTALHKKLLRDLVRLRWQALTIAILVGCGIASFVSAIAASASLRAACDLFYADARMADVFAHVVRAPSAVLDRLRDLPGVAAVDGRVLADFRVEMEGTTDPIVGRFVSAARAGENGLCKTQILVGREVLPGSADEVVVSQAFAESWSLEPGSSLTAVINERRTALHVVGIGVSPEFVFVRGPRTGLTDTRHFGILWMDASALAKATDYQGAFNDVVLQLAAAADVTETVRRVDVILEPYGGLGAQSRAEQPSARLMDQKVDQLVRLARSLPVIFLGVAAFLLNVLLSRIVGTQREQIATLKALGYRTRELLEHYLELSALICGAGIAIGLGLGVAGAKAMMRSFAHYFKLPAYPFRLDGAVVAIVCVVTFAAGVLGTWAAVRKAVAIPPAEAMRPEAPPAYKPTALDRLYRFVSPLARMLLRDVQRKPVRFAFSAASIALATSITLAGNVYGDSIAETLRLQYEVSHREDITVTLDDARPWRAVRDAEHVPGVVHVEGERQVAVRLRARHLDKTTAILGLRHDADLHALLGANRRKLELPPGGLSLSRVLGDILEVRAGDTIEVEVLEGERKKLRVPIVALVDDILGFFAYMDANELAKLLDEPARANVLLLSVAPEDVDAVTERLKALPMVAAVSRPSIDQGLLRSEIADVFTILSIVLALFATAIAVGVVYNNARIALELRSRDLATMRILGFTRGELAFVLLGEQMLQVVAGVVPGLWLGKAMGAVWMRSVDRELIRIPVTVAPASYVGSLCVVALAALISALVVRSRADKLDLVAVLKARD